MMGSFLTRGFVMVFGYAYPAYECFKTVEKNKPDIEQLRFWCQYWILVAALTVFERVGDTFVSWVPMYSEAKLAFFIYLWYPKTKGTAYVYDSFFRPFVAKHETEIDRNILELRTRAGDIAIQYWHRAATYSQTRVFEILQYVASQSTSRPRPAPAPSQTQGAGARQPPPAVPPPAVRTRQPAAAPQPPQTSRSSSVPSTQQEQVPSRTSSTGSTQQRVPPSRTSSAPLSTGTTQQQQEPVQERNPPASPARAAVVQSEAVKSVAKLISQSSESEAEAMQIEAESSSANESANPPPQETVMEEVIRVTRGRLRKNRQ